MWLLYIYLSKDMTAWVDLKALLEWLSYDVASYKKDCLSVQTPLFRLVTIKECLTLAMGELSAREAVPQC